MTEQTLDGHAGTHVQIDLCLACQAFWFDGFESLKLAPASVLTLFHVIGDQASAPRAPLADTAKCPRCGVRLVPTHDMQQTTSFHYLRCPLKHGRLITFFNFLREKHFIRPLSGAQIEELRRNVQVVNCSNCGAPIDLAKGSSCSHCGSPLSMIDMKQAEALIASLRAADQPGRAIDPALPLRLEQARREVEATFQFDSDVFTSIARWLSRHV